MQNIQAHPFTCSNLFHKKGVPANLKQGHILTCLVLESVEPLSNLVQLNPFLLLHVFKQSFSAKTLLMHIFHVIYLAVTILWCICNGTSPCFLIGYIWIEIICIYGSNLSVIETQYLTCHPQCSGSQHIPCQYEYLGFTDTMNIIIDMLWPYYFKPSFIFYWLVNMYLGILPPLGLPIKYYSS